MCAGGLDTIPLPGDINEDQLFRILGDVDTLACKWQKPLAACLLPIPGKKPGDRTEFDDPRDHPLERLARETGRRGIEQGNLRRRKPVVVPADGGVLVHCHWEGAVAPGALAMPRARAIDSRPSRSFCFNGAEAGSAARLRNSRGSFS